MKHLLSEEYIRMQKLAGIINEQEKESPEEEAFDKDLMATANSIAGALGKQLKAKKGQAAGGKEKLDEAVVTSVIAAVMSGNAIVGLVSKLSKNLFKKLGWKKGEDIAEKIHHWAHDNEKAFQAPIKRVLGFFIKDPAKLELTVKAIYALVILTMAGSAGAGAVQKLSKADWFMGSFKALKTIAKADEVIANAYPVVKAIGG